MLPPTLSSICCRPNVFPALLYGLDACTLNNAETKSFEFALFRVYAKIFSTTSKDIIEDCCLAFGIDSIAILINKRKLGFLARYSASLTEVCSVFRSEASSEIRVLKSKLASSRLARLIDVLLRRSFWTSLDQSVCLPYYMELRPVL